MYFVFFFTQKTAYEMRISDWSSDVCSSDLSLAFECASRRADSRKRIDFPISIINLGAKNPHHAPSVARYEKFISLHQRTPGNDTGRQWTPIHDGTIFGTLARFFEDRHSSPKGAQQLPSDGIRLISNLDKIIRLRTVLARTGPSRSSL